jgi:hypothetical protein
MARLSQKRQQAIYNAVTDEIMRARIELAGVASRNSARIVRESDIDRILGPMQDRAGQAAILSAEGKEKGA